MGAGQKQRLRTGSPDPVLKGHMKTGRAVPGQGGALCTLTARESGVLRMEAWDEKLRN